MNSVNVGLGARAYDVVIGAGLLADTGAHISGLLQRPRVAVVTDENVAAIHLAGLRDGLAAGGVSCVELVLPAGEQTKSWKYYCQTVDWLLENKIERDDVVVAFGGGVIGDLVGFAAATLRRGVRFVQIPTTLLAQVDSSVGGKTGINSQFGKNLIGAFHQPTKVLADIDLLGTLTSRDLLSGYGEVMKYGALGDLEFFNWLENNGPALSGGDLAAREYAVTKSVQMKADIVVRDEFEKGDRALLNLGHTFCHALEAATGYSDRLLHGEGVAIGCALAFETSARLGLCSQEEPSRLREHLKAMGMMSDLADIKGDLPDADALYQLMTQDKKMKNGKLNFIMARSIGDAFVTNKVDPELIKSVLADALG
ncbi:MAG: 3-dehydroquinate synthase [Paracoccaceae bacterium]